MRHSLKGFLVLLGLLFSCAVPKEKEEVLYAFDFGQAADLGYFKAETEVGDSEVGIAGDALDIDAVKGATVWFTKKLTAPIRIEYTAVVVDNDGPNDRVSDLNCFFMAIDPRCPSDIFSCADSVRTGIFGDYHDLRTYYVGYGGNGNTTTRMRRYPGYTRLRPMLPEHDLGPPNRIVANKPIKVAITVKGNRATYAHDGITVFEMNDDLPYHEGWFAFRTVRNHMQIRDFKVVKPGNLKWARP